MLSPKKNSKENIRLEKDRYISILKNLGWEVEDDDIEDVLWFTGPEGLMYHMTFDLLKMRFVGLYLNSAMSDLSFETVGKIGKLVAEEYRVLKSWSEDESLTLAYEFMDVDEAYTEAVLHYAIGALKYAFDEVFEKFGEAF